MKQCAPYSLRRELIMQCGLCSAIAQYIQEHCDAVKLPGEKRPLIVNACVNSRISGEDFEALVAAAPNLIRPASLDSLRRADGTISWAALYAVLV